MDYLIRIIPDVQPVSNGCRWKDYRHPIVNECNALCGRPGKDREHRIGTMLNTVQARQIDHLAAALSDGILNLLPILTCPLKIVGCGDQATPMCHSILEHWFAGSGLAPGIDNRPATISHRIAPAHCECCLFLAAVVGNHRSNTSREYLCYYKKPNITNSL